MESTIGIKVIFFDVTGTLLHIPRGLGNQYTVVALRHGIRLNPQKVGEAFKAAWRDLPAREPYPGARPDDDRSWWHELVSLALQLAGAQIPSSQFEPFFAELYDHFGKPGVWEPYPEVPAVLERLSGHHHLGIISNFDKRLYPVLDNLNLRQFFEHVIVSSEAGADKPHRQIFDVALSRFGVKPHEALHVGDHPSEDWAGARDAGLHVFELKRPENSLETLCKERLKKHAREQ